MSSTQSPQETNPQMHFSPQHFFFGLATIVLLFAVSIWAKSILIPFVFSVILSFIFLPITRFLERRKLNRIVAILLSFLLVLLLIAGVFYFFSAQIIRISSDFVNFKSKLLEVYQKALTMYNSNLGEVAPIDTSGLLDQAKNWLTTSGGNILSKTLSQTGTFLSNLTLIPICTFFFLLYRTGIRRALSHLVDKNKQQTINDMLSSVQQVGQKYIFGLGALMLILGILNSTALWIIGIEYPFFFGFLASILAIIPYVGTIVGAIVPAFYALITYDSLFYPIAVLAAFAVIQFIDGNFLNPKIVGSGINLNPLTAILALLVGASIWGFAGMILFIPMAAIVKIMCQNYVELSPIAELMGEGLYEEPESDGLGWWKKLKAKFFSK